MRYLQFAILMSPYITNSFDVISNNFECNGYTNTFEKFRVAFLILFIYNFTIEIVSEWKVIS
jgi:hypothetical protein